jgi:hypothetical protein
MAKKAAKRAKPGRKSARNKFKKSARGVATKTVVAGLAAIPIAEKADTEVEDTAAARGSVEIRIDGRSFPLTTSGRHLARAAMQWTYVVRSRQRWAATDHASDQAAKAGDLLNELGIDEGALEEIAHSGIAEVSIEWLKDEEQGWANRILPWEYVIAGGTRAVRGGQPLTVIRNLRVPNPPKAAASFKSVLFVVSEPGPLQGRFLFDSEQDLVRNNLNVSAQNWHVLANPTRSALMNAIGRIRPDVVHLAGFDSHMASYLLRESSSSAASKALEQFETAVTRSSSDAIRDGYVLAGSRDELDPVDAETLGAILTSDGHRPRLVAINLGNSAARIAPMIVAAGADSAIGFQDSFNDSLSEFFFSALYSKLAEPKAEVSLAFRAAWERVRLQRAHRQGSGIVLWNARSLFDKGRPKQAMAAAQDTYAVLDPKTLTAEQCAEWVAVDVDKEMADLNYSMLHNHRPLFTKFSIRSLKGRTLHNVQVEVSLSTGVELSKFECAIDVALPNFPSYNLSGDIHVPLTSAITRSIHESVSTSILIQVTWGGHLLYRQTKRVRLTPVDQWRDNDADRIWLPSFIFPRDAAVSQLVDTAQRYVRVLRDDPVAGFDGYQSFDENAPDPAAEIDLQVQAIWSAIVHEMRLGYINPPPGYSRQIDSQRLRTPSMITRYHSGTCIDLSLFFAACLELVDIYPVIFLLSGHAFPGYWRSSDYHEAFIPARPDEIQSIVRADSRSDALYGAQKEQWFLGKPTYREIVECVKANRLVPLETVRLTENCGFWEAIDAGRENLRSQREFEAMVDVALARENQVTPLPILGEQQ